MKGNLACQGPPKMRSMTCAIWLDSTRAMGSVVRVLTSAKLKPVTLRYRLHDLLHWWVTGTDQGPEHGKQFRRTEDQDKKKRDGNR